MTQFDDSYDDGIRVNFTEKEAGSVPFELLPKGKYPVAVTDISVEAVRSGPNEGKPFFSMEFTVQDGKYVNRKLWTNVMLFVGKDGTLGKLAQMLKSQGVDVQAGDFVVPGAEQWMGKTMLAHVRVQPKREVEGKTYEERNDVNGFSKLEGTFSAASEEKRSLLD